MARYAPDAEIVCVVAATLLQRNFVVNLVALAYQAAVHTSEPACEQYSPANLHPGVTTNPWGSACFGFQHLEAGRWRCQYPAYKSLWFKRFGHEDLPFGWQIPLRTALDAGGAAGEMMRRG
jgi:hypothetical protein